jgi:hypothetical protein
MDFLAKYAIHTVAFYNFENLLPNDPTTNDDEWTPGAQHWTSKVQSKTAESFLGFTGNRLGGKYKFPHSLVVLKLRIEAFWKI